MPRCNPIGVFACPPRYLCGAFLFAALLGLPAAANAVCGDGSTDADEQCDDGNLLDGDCCSASCTFEAYGSNCAHGIISPCVRNPTGFCSGDGACLGRPPCSAYGFGASLTISDEPGTESDRLTWRLRPGKWVRFNQGFLPPFGDPTLDTSYAICLYDLSEHEWTGGVTGVRYEKVFPVGSPWEAKQRRWELEVSGAAGAVKLRVNNRARLDIRGDIAELPGPLDATRYFDRMAVGLIPTQGRCFLHRAGGFSWKPKENTATSFRFHARAYVND